MLLVLMYVMIGSQTIEEVGYVKHVLDTQTDCNNIELIILDYTVNKRLKRKEHVRFPCGECNRAVQGNHRGICCDQCNRWFHTRCANVSNSNYTRLSNSSEGWLHCQRCASRQQEQQSTPPGEMTQQQYLHSHGWQTQNLHEQSWAKTHINQFQTKQNQWQHKKMHYMQ